MDIDNTSSANDQTMPTADDLAQAILPLLEKLDRKIDAVIAGLRKENPRSGVPEVAEAETETDPAGSDAAQKAIEEALEREAAIAKEREAAISASDEEWERDAIETVHRDEDLFCGWVGRIPWDHLQAHLARALVACDTDDALYYRDATFDPETYERAFDLMPKALDTIFGEGVWSTRAIPSGEKGSPPTLWIIFPCLAGEGAMPQDPPQEAP